MRLKLILLLAGFQILSADSFVFGIGAGRSHYYRGESIDSSYVSNSLWRLEAEAGYYTGTEGFDVLFLYGENLIIPVNSNILTRDLHLALLGEYRLFLLNPEGTIQGALSLGPSIRRFHFYSESEVTRRPFRFHVDLGVGMLFFTGRHLLVRGQAAYSFPPLHPFDGGVLSLTLRASFRS